MSQAARVAFTLRDTGGPWSGATQTRCTSDLVVNPTVPNANLGAVAARVTARHSDDDGDDGDGDDGDDGDEGDGDGDGDGGDEP